MPRSCGSVLAGAVTLFLGGNTPLTRGIPLPQHDRMQCAALRADAHVVAVACTNGDVTEYDAHTGDCTMRVNLGAAFDVRVAQLCYAPDGTLFAAVASDHVVVALARDAAPRWMRVNATCVENVTGVCATPRLLVVAVMHSSVAGGLVVMDRRRGVVIRSTKRVADGRLRTVGHVCATRDGAHVAVGETAVGSRISVFAFTATDGLVCVRAVGQGVIASLRSFAFSGAGELLAVDFNRKTPTVFDDLGQQGALAHVWRTPWDGSCRLAFVAVGGDAVLTVTRDGWCYVSSLS
jgi:hypothetical protein